MFRCITELKGLVIDIDSFNDAYLLDWQRIMINYHCLFITSNKLTQLKLSDCYSGCVVYYVEEYVKQLAPNHATHSHVLNTLNLNTTEVAYVSKSINFLNRAMYFLSGTIWVTEEISYSNASKAPDLICRNFNKLIYALDNDVKGFFGEIDIFPTVKTAGTIIPVQFVVNDEIVPLYMLGRYFGYSHYMNQLHPYSTSIYLNKQSGKVFGKLNDKFIKSFTVAIKRIQEINRIDGLCAVPTRPSEVNRFKDITQSIAQNCDILDLSELFICNRDYPNQKGLSQPEREENVKGVFTYNGSLIGKNIVIIDDVISTGSTMRECIKELKCKGVERIFIVVLAVNQKQGTYWSSNEPRPLCSTCNQKMFLRINSNNKQFFYSCNNCNHKTLDFESGWETLCQRVNDEFKNNN